METAESRPIFRVGDRVQRGQKFRSVRERAVNKTYRDDGVITFVVTQPNDPDDVMEYWVTWNNGRKSKLRPYRLETVND